MKTLRKLLLAPIAVLAFAGALSAINGAGWMNPHGSITVIGEGAAPCPMVLAPASANPYRSPGAGF